MNENGRLDSWKEIANYVEKSVKTVQRWEKESVFPIYRVEGKKSVYTFKKDVDAWLIIHNSPKNENNGQNDYLKSDIPIITTVATPRSSKSISLLILLSIIIPILILTISWYSLQNYRYARGNGLKVIVETKRGLTTVSVLNKRGESLELLRTSNVNLQFHKVCYGSQFVDFSDFDGDGIEEIVFANHIKTDSYYLMIYKMNIFGKYEIFDQWDIELLFQYNGETYQNYSPYFVTCEDVNEDGIDEILLIQNSQPFFPSCLRVFTIAKKELLRLYHPGRFGQVFVQDRNKNGIKDIILTGTNNFLRNGSYKLGDTNIDEYSSPILLDLEKDWKIPEQINMFGAKKTMTYKCNDKNTSIIYINLRKDKCNKQCEIWEYSFLSSNERMTNSRNFFRIYAGFTLIDKIDGNNVSQIRRCSRQYYFSRELKLINAYFDKNNILKYFSNQQFKEEPLLLSPLYWNGENWQEEMCYVRPSKIKIKQ